MYGKVVIPTDGSKLSYIGVIEGLRAAKAHGIPALAVYVMKPASYSEGLIDYDMDDVDFSARDIIDEAMKREGEKVLERVEKKAEEMDVDIETKHVEGKPYDEITRLTDQDDIIYMSSHGHSGLSSIFMGSTTERVLKHTKATVAVVKPKDSN